MFIQLQFLSPYKISHTLYSSNHKLQTLNRKNRFERSILTTNIHIFYISLFLTKSLKANKLPNTVKTAPAQITKKFSCFFLPTTKKTVIFLRAPYKNKLARLNILQTNHKFVISGMVDAAKVVYKPLVEFFKNLNLSSFKIKHVKTKLKYTTVNTNNFILNNYN